LPDADPPQAVPADEEELPAAGVGDMDGAALGRHLLSVADLVPRGLEEILDLTDRFVEVSARPVPKVPALRAKTVVSMFFEDSTRTRLSFETAARRLSADVMTFSAGASSINKGESLRDTVATLEAMGVDAMVVRHRSAGVPHQVAGWVQGLSVINAGDGAHEHPTQALLDCYTVAAERSRRFGAPAGPEGIRGLRVAIVGDILHSRVARSGVLAFGALGAEVTLVGPPTLMPPSIEGWPARLSYELDPLLRELDVIYLLRLQNERMQEALIPSLREYRGLYGLDRRRAGLLGPRALIMHPGPVNRGVELDSEVADDPRSVITAQVANGVAVRMAVLYRLLGRGSAGA